MQLSSASLRAHSNSISTSRALCKRALLSAMPVNSWAMRTRSSSSSTDALVR